MGSLFFYLFGLGKTQKLVFNILIHIGNSGIFDTEQTGSMLDHSVDALFPTSQLHIKNSLCHNVLRERGNHDRIPHLFQNTRNFIQHLLQLFRDAQLRQLRCEIGDHAPGNLVFIVCQIKGQGVIINGMAKSLSNFG